MEAFYEAFQGGVVYGGYDLGVAEEAHEIVVLYLAGDLGVFLEGHDARVFADYFCAGIGDEALHGIDAGDDLGDFIEDEVNAVWDGVGAVEHGAGRAGIEGLLELGELNGHGVDGDAGAAGGWGAGEIDLGLCDGAEAADTED